MSNRKSENTADYVTDWQDIFDDIEIKSIPLQYIKSIHVQFVDGKVWAIDVGQNQVNDSNVSELEATLDAFFDEYDDVIEAIDFSLNVQKVQKDIQKRTRRFMKKRK